MIRMHDDPPGRIAELADQCVMCGLCLPHCPTYALDATEAESPRGRIRLAQALAAGETAAGDVLREHLDHCLGCLQCERVCPSRVRYGELLVQTRALLGPSPQRPAWLLGVLKRPRLAGPLLGLARTLRVRRWLAPLLARIAPRRSAALRAALERLGPRPPPSPARPVSTSPLQGTVALFPGCIASIEDAAALDAADTLLRAAGLAVQRLPAMCCGAMDLHDGVTAGAEASARPVQQACRDLAADTTVLTVTPGCLGTLRRDLPDARVEDALGFLSRHGEALRFRPLDERVALHLACTRRNVARDGADVAALLRRVPNLDVRELPESPGCCGAAGSHALAFPERADRLRAIRLRQIAEVTADRLLSSNIGCRLHLAAGLGAMAHEHPLTLLARQLETSR
jgi:glycolate oxidase iron-sulfur subunit